MSFEKPKFESRKELDLEAKIKVEPGFRHFIPVEFSNNPLGYFEDKGKNIKSGEIKRDETGKTREDPTAVKELPVWTGLNGQELLTIGKRVNTEKGKVGESGDLFYEYKIMEIVRSVGLPASQPIAKIEHNGTNVFIMEKIQGMAWFEREILHLKEKGYTDKDVGELKEQAELMMMNLQQQFENAGVIRGWKLKDMIFDIDVENKKINKITPVDWEKTKINKRKLERYKKRQSFKSRKN